MPSGKEKTTENKENPNSNKNAGRKKGADKNIATGKKRGKVINLSEDSMPNTGKKLSIDPADIVFAMDIGTRSVVGVVGAQEDDYFRVIATEIIEHKSRAMLDGQIHDVEQVAAVAALVRDKLEARLGIKLKKVAIAAAGRVLRTCQVKVEKSLEQGREIDAELVNSLEIEGIQRAQLILDEELSREDKTQFYCVGYSIINYYLNGYVISKLVGHKGKSIGADVLATFLPMIVVDDLYTVMNRIGLEVSSLTLEPIAAINVTIPPDLRLLNLALVDIGAGTSDIAITKDGSIIAYAMVPIAGDELTERISQNYLVDFNTGEKIKLSLSSNKDTISFIDILKNKHTVTTAEVINSIRETVQLLAATVSEKILEYNHKAPNAIFLVGGGSRIPGLTDLIAKQLDLPSDRVVVRGRDVIRNIKFDDKKLYGPESITPYGIAVTAQMYSGKDFMTVTVNEKKIKLFNSKKLTVADALILFGYDAGQLIGRTGKSIHFTVNGETRTVRGGYGKAAEISVDGKPASLDTPIFYGDVINVVPAQLGDDASVNVIELVSEYSAGLVRLNGNPVDISTVIYINGNQVSKDSKVNDGDEIQIFRIKTLKELLDAGGLDIKEFDVCVNDEQSYSLDYILKDGDIVITRKHIYETQDAKPVASSINSDISPAEAHAVKNTEAAENTEAAHSASDIYVQPTEIQTTAYDNTSTVILGDTLKKQCDAAKTTSADLPQPIGNKTAAGPDNISPATPGHTSSLEEPSFKVTVNGRDIKLKYKKSPYIFVDIFNFIDFDLTKPQGNIVLRLNGRSAAFTDMIQPGDSIEIGWNK